MSGDANDPRLQRREHAEAILRAAVAAADPAPLVRRALHGAVELDDEARVRLLAIGKAAPAMAGAAHELLDGRVAETLVVAPHGTPTAGTPPDATVLYGAHPAPDEHSVAAGRAVMALLDRAVAGDIVVVLLSGGASACIAVPLADIDIADYAGCVNGLMRAGADIRELNIVRKHIDALKGGRMAVRAAPAAVLGLVLSDVVGDPLEVIASGPLSPDPTTCDDALHVLRRHGLLDDCAPSIRELLTACAQGGGESPGEDDDAFAAVRVRVIGGNDVAINGAADMAAELGYTVRRSPEPVTGSARDAGASLAREARLLQRTESAPVCIVVGGETTVAVQGAGRGGRNQELVLAACVELGGLLGITVGSVGTDGVDGPTDAAGAIADETTLDRAAALGIAAHRLLDDNDSHSFFAAVDGLLVTGPTGTNVNDVQIALIEPPGHAPLA